MYNVLLVDDEPRTMMALEKNVDWNCYGVRNVFKAVNKDEAIEIYQKEQIDILISDIEMPGGSGLQLLEWFRAQKIDINCIFLTCHPEFDYMRQAIKLRCYDYILKPIRYDEFCKVLYELIRKMEANDMGDKMSEAIRQNEKMVGEIVRIGSVQDRRDVEVEVKRYVREHLTENISVNEIGTALHYNPKYLMRVFKTRTNISIVEYITFERIEMAKKILAETGYSIQEVSSMVGYSDYAYFNRVFKKVTGSSPGSYRKQNK